MLVVLSLTHVATAQSGGTCTPGVAAAVLDANNVQATVYNTGSLFYGAQGNSGYEIPRGSGVTSIYAANFWVGGLVDGELRMVAGTYAQGGADFEFFPGPVPPTGAASTDCAPHDRIWHVSDDDILRYEQTGALTADLRDWPVDLGAPVVDGDGVAGNYNLAGGDRPEVWGDQTAWWIMNDTAGPHWYTLTPPIQLEVRVQAFAAACVPELGTSGLDAQVQEAVQNATFYRYQLTYYGDAPLDDAYVGLWMDPDLGYRNDDYIGSDSSLSLGFVYNADVFDESNTLQAQYGYNDKPPALGAIILQGLNNHTGSDLGMQYFISPGRPAELGAVDVVHSARTVYNLMQGLWLGFYPLTYGGNGAGDDLGLGPTKHMFSGHPPAFWSEENIDGHGSRSEPGDRRFLMSSGPITWQPGEKQEIVLAIAWAQTNDRLGSVRRLKQHAAVLRGYYDSLARYDLATCSTETTTPVVEVPDGYAFTVYPNPATDAATLRVHLPISERVTLRVYDVLGREIQTLMAGQTMTAQIIAMPLDIKSWAAGVYVVRLEAGPYVASRRLVVR